jgi:murein L,D-transpeptidase YafK
MTGGLCQTGRAILAVCVTATVLVRAECATAQVTDIKEFAAQRAERKKAASDGKVPLPGTPDLTRLEARLSEKGVPTDAPIYIRIFKAESELEIWTGDEAGNYALFATYPICFWSGTLGPKLKEGDRQAPEGFYTVALQQTRHSGRWPQSLDLEFPNPFDQVSQRNGSAILIHGGCASIGCFAMTNAVNLEVHKLTVTALEAGQPYVPIHVFPFRMTEQNLAAFADSEWSGFWRNLKEGYDLFERTHRPPRVTVCGTRYGFEAASRLEGANPGPIRVCPETAQMIADLSHINTRVAEEKTETAPAKVASLIGPASYLGGPAVAAAGTIANKLAEDYEQQIAPATAHAGVSPLLTRSLPCSLALPSCRRYAALREQLAQKASLRLEEPEREKASAPKKKSAKKKKSSGRRYSEYRGEELEYRGSVREYGRSEDRQWREFRSSRYE